MAAAKKATKKVVRKVKKGKPAKKAAKKIKKPAKKVAKAKTPAQGWTPDYGELLDGVEKKSKLSANMTDRFKFAVSSGLLVQDLILGGGYVSGGMYTFAGMEQSAKSTSIMNFLGDLIQSEHQPGAIMYVDAEGSFDPDYFNAMLGKAAVDSQELFGIKDKNGKYTVAPRIRYYPESRGEMVIDALNSMLARMPDKEYLDGQWYFVYENTVPNRKMVGDKYSKNLFSKTNKFYVPTDISAPQAVIVVDSWIALVPERVDDEDKSAGLGANARMFSETLPKLKGKLRRKAVILMGVNQLREKPMTQGDPRYEPGGQALKFYSDFRMWNTPRSIPHGTGMIEEEKSVTGEGFDTYKYIHFKNKKNKLSTPYMEGWARIWVEDAGGQAHGFDRVYDAFQYLKMTGQVTGTMGKRGMSITLRGKNELKIKKLDWLQFKAMILLTGDARKKVCKKVGLKKPINLYKLCQAQMRSGLAKELYYENKQNKAKDDDDDED